MSGLKFYTLITLKQQFSEEIIPNRVINLPLFCLTSEKIHFNHHCGTVPLAGVSLKSEE